MWLLCPASLRQRHNTSPRTNVLGSAAAAAAAAGGGLTAAAAGSRDDSASGAAAVAAGWFHGGGPCWAHALADHTVTQERLGDAWGQTGRQTGRQKE